MDIGGFLSFFSSLYPVLFTQEKKDDIFETWLNTCIGLHEGLFFITLNPTIINV